jgi:hypothetical protein
MAAEEAVSCRNRLFFADLLYEWLICKIILLIDSRRANEMRLARIRC